ERPGLERLGGAPSAGPLRGVVDRLLAPLQPDEERPPPPGRRLRHRVDPLDQLERRGFEPLRSQPRQEREERLRLPGREGQRLVPRRDRTQPHVRVRDQPDRAAAPDHELDQVVAGHVLDDPSAELEDPTITGHEPEPEDVVARRAMRLPERARARLREDRSDRRRGVSRRVEREPLSAAGEFGLQRLERRPAADGRDQVRRLVRRRDEEPARRQDDVDPFGWTSGVQPRPRARGLDRPPFAAREGEDRGRLVDRSGEGDDAGPHTVDRPARRRIARPDAFVAQDPPEPLEHRPRHPPPGLAPWPADAASGPRSGPCATAGWAARSAPGRASRAVSGASVVVSLDFASRAPAARSNRAGKTFPGFASPRGSKTHRTACINASSALPTTRSMYSRLSSPTPCSPVMVPPASTHRRMISRDAASTRRTSSALRRSKRMFGCRFPSPAWKTFEIRSLYLAAIS